MRKQEQRLWDRMREAINGPEVWLQRVENGVAAGMPDVLAICRANGMVTWVELKCAKVPARATTRVLGDDGLNVEQKNWHFDWRQYGGVSFILIKTADGQLFLVPGLYADNVNEMPMLTLTEVAVAFDWKAIKEQLT